MPLSAKLHDLVVQVEADMAALHALTDQPSPPADDVLIAARWALVRSLAEGASLREKFLFAPLEASGDAGLVANGKMMVDVMHDVMKRLIAHSERWPPLAVRNNWLGYRLAQADAHQVIREYFAWEGTIVPQMLDALQGTSAAPKRNWTRPIWALHDALNPG